MSNLKYHLTFTQSFSTTPNSIWCTLSLIWANQIKPIVASEQNFVQISGLTSMFSSIPWCLNGPTVFSYTKINSNYIRYNCSEYGRKAITVIKTQPALHHTKETVPLTRSDYWAMIANCQLREKIMKKKEFGSWIDIYENHLTFCLHFGGKRRRNMKNGPRNW